MKWIWVILLLPQFFAPGIQRFVATTGDDNSGNGNIDNPYATITRALSVSGAGDTIVLRTGTYRETVLIHSSRIVMHSHRGEWAVISLPTDNQNLDVAVTIAAGTEYCALKRLEIRGGYYHAVLLNSNWEDDESIPFDQRKGASHVTIEDCRLYGSGAEVVKILPRSDFATVRRCEIYNAGARDPASGTGIDVINSANMFVQDSHIYDVPAMAITTGGGAVRTIIERSLIRNCGGGVSLGKGNTPWNLFDTTANPLAHESIDSNVRNSILLNIRDAGITLAGSLNSLVFNNTLVDVSYENDAGIVIAPAKHTIGVPETRTTACKAFMIANNVVAGASGGNDLMMIIEEDAIEGTYTISHNRYFVLGGTALFQDRRTGMEFSGILSDWKTHAGETNSTEGDPGLDVNYHLAPGSPCINTGRPIPILFDDYDGNTRSGAIDIGADEVGGPPLQVPPSAGVIGTGRLTAVKNIPSISGFHLLGNSPNPFSAYTSVKFELDAARILTMTVFDILGRIVHRSERIAFAPGEQRYHLSTAGWQPGWYFYTISSGANSNTGVMVLVR